MCWSLRYTVQHPGVHLAPRHTPREPATLPRVPVTQHGDQQQEQQRERSGSRPPALPQQLEARKPRLYYYTTGAGLHLHYQHKKINIAKSSSEKGEAIIEHEK